MVEALQGKWQPEEEGSEKIHRDLIWNTLAPPAFSASCAAEVPARPVLSSSRSTSSGYVAGTLSAAPSKAAAAGPHSAGKHAVGPTTKTAQACERPTSKSSPDMA